MKTLGRIFLLLVLVALTAVPAMADGATTNTRFFYEEGPGTGYSVCLGEEAWDVWEVADYFGSYRAVLHTTLTPSGAYNGTYNEVGSAAGVGRDTGYHYEAHWTWHEHINVRAGEVQQVSWPLVLRNLDTGQLQIHDAVAHLTINANGEVIVIRNWGEPRCPGPDR